jgi:serine protease Do
MLFGNLLAFFPLVFNMQAIQFLKKTRELSQNQHIQQYKKAVVVVKADDRKGTGFNVDAQGLIITNQHVVEDAKFASVSFDEGGIYRAEVIVADASIDIAVLRIINSASEVTNRVFSTLSIETRQQWNAGMPIYVIGNPLFFNRIANEGTVVGLISLEGWELPVMTIKAPIYKGNSGSPIINHEGNVIAVVFATTKVVHDGAKQKVGLAIPIQYLLKYIDTKL